MFYQGFPEMVLFALDWTFKDLWAFFTWSRRKGHFTEIEPTSSIVKGNWVRVTLNSGTCEFVTTDV